MTAGLFSRLAALLRGGPEKLHFYEDEDHAFSPAERGVIPGAPPTPAHPRGRRILYAATSALVGLTGALGNGLTVVNLPYIQGSLGLNASEVAWLPAAYLVTGAIAGSLLVKYRQRFGIRSFSMFFLAAQVLVIAAHLWVRGLESAIAIRAAGGVCGVALLSLGVFYMIQAFPPAYRLNAVALGIGIPQLALPIARVVPKDSLAFGNWSGLYLFELGLSMITLATVMVVRLPPNRRENMFEPLDAFTFVVYAAGVLLLGASLGIGGYLWWTNVPWIGWSLALAIPCLVLAMAVEGFRRRPLIDVRWLSSAAFIRWSVIAILWRVAIAEQSIGAVGMLRDFGLTNDDFYDLSLVILLSAVAGLLLSALIVGPKRLSQMVIAALLLVSAAAFVDSFSGIDTRPPQFFLTQATIAFATTLFIGPSFLFGLTRVIAEGGTKMTSFIALFGITQAIGTLAGTAFVQSYLYAAQQYHLAAFAAGAERSQPLVAARLAEMAGRYDAVIADRFLKSAEGTTALSQRILLHARVAAYDDVFFAVAIVSLASAAAICIALGANRATGLLTRKDAR